jgi:putative dimethyl sulfoxide reductase chaperone
MNYETLIEHETIRQNIYQGLAQCYQCPGKGLNATVQGLESWFAVLQSNALPLILLLRNSFDETQDLKHLQIDFAKLFVGPYSLLAPPYASIYLENKRRVMGQSTIEVIHFYRRAGVEMAPAFRDAPDHIAVEMEFMYFLIGTQINAMALTEEERFLEILDSQNSFLNGHLNRWVREFTQSIKKGAQTDFYINLADATHHFITEDADYLSNLEIGQG